MKPAKYLLLIAVAITSLAPLCQTGLYADTSALPAPAAALQPASVSAPLDEAGASSVKAIAANVSGDVTVQRKGKTDYEPLGEKAEVFSGDLVKTGEGICRIMIGGKAQVFVEPNTVLSVTEVLRNEASKSESTKLTLQSGKLKVQLPNLKRGSTFEVSTPTAVATVRGTIFYLFVGNIQDKLASQLYVDKSDGGVLFKNLFTGDSILVPHFSLSQSFQDGTLEPPKALTPEEQKEFVQKWESLGGVSQQFGIEEIPLNNPAAPPSPDIPAGFADTFEKFGLNDAFVDKLAEQNILGQNLDVPLTPLVAAPKTGGDDTGGTPPDQGTGETPPDEGTGGTTDPVITDADRSMILRVLGQSLTDQEFDQIDAGQAQTEDAQTSKVFTDVHGNRVRVDQYITQSSPSSVSFLSLTLREGPYQTGITSLLFATQFNDVLTGNFRDLPWNDYLNVVTSDELTGLNAGQQYDQFIVHEHSDSPAGPPALYPTEMVALFMSPLQANQTDFSNFGFVFFAEGYSSPFRVSSDQGSFWVQGMDQELVAVVHGSGEVAASTGFAGQPRQTFVNGNQFASFQDSGGPQTAGLATSPALSQLQTTDGLDIFRNGLIHPAYFANQFGDDRMLIGMFFPIDDNGQVFDAPGFRLRGLRDIVHPNTLVNGGAYNLEIILLYGSRDQNDAFSEIFRIDSIITPEIFSGSVESGPGFGLKGLNGELVTDTVFPSTLDTSDPDLQSV